jgi:repressor LexA
VTSEGAADRPQIGGRLRRVLDFLRDFTDEHGYPPSMAQIGAGVGLTSTSSVAHQLGVLEGRGYIARTPGVPRAITILDVPTTVYPHCETCRCRVVPPS